MLSPGKGHHEPERRLAGPISAEQARPKELILFAPLRFGCLEPKLYRGSFPLEGSLNFLRTLGLKTILSLTPEPLKESIPGIEYVHIKCSPTTDKSKKKRPVPVTGEIVEAALEILEDEHMRPLYVHCLNGSQITGLITACYRRRQQWSMSSSLMELERYSDYDQKEIRFIEEVSQDQAYFV